VEKKLKEIANQAMKQMHSVGKKHKTRSRQPHFIDEVVLDLHQTLDELEQHNLLIKHFLRDELYGMAGVFLTLFVFMLGDHA